MRIVLVDRDSLTGRRWLTYQRIDWAECVLCGCDSMYGYAGEDGDIWDGNSAVCHTCGAVDMWTADESGAHLAGFPADGEEVSVLREIWETPKAQAEWADIRDSYSYVSPPEPSGPWATDIDPLP